ncbi:hypothetical protein [Salinarimonas chemoclinalis]|uniref:hypothetical protein n=1 Tax=Salinarimonas chemoclinalis TaxID=3241599 RepID=UPI0035588755
MVGSAASIVSFLRWRLVPVRYAGRVRHLRPHHLTPAARPVTEAGRRVEDTGHAEGPTASPELLAELQGLYRPRIPAERPEGLKAPFVNLVKPEDLTPENPLMRLAFSPEVLDVAIDYFGGRCTLDSLQVLYSFPVREQGLSESQKWHLDYGDSRSFHCVMYLNDVLDDEHGPFVFVDKRDTRRIKRGMVIRRVEDAQFQAELGDGTIRSFYAEAGRSVLIDPAACYHYGSRCKTGRLAVFVTFSSDKPFLNATPLVREHSGRILAAAKELRPDLGGGALDKLLAV